MICLVIKKPNPAVAELFIRNRKLNTSLVFITQSDFVAPKNIKLNSAQCFIMKILNKPELQQTAYNNPSDIDFRYVKNLYKNVLQNDIFIVIDTTLASDNHLRFRKDLGIIIR